MSESIKLPFDPIPVGGATALADPPRPSFSRSTAEPSTGGLLPPTRKPVVTTPTPTLPAGIAPEATAPVEPNPAAGTPPPNPAAVGGIVKDLFRPSRSKWAIAAGMVSLFAGAYGLNLVMPTTAPSDKKKLTETAKENGPQPKIETERTSPQTTLERSGENKLFQASATLPAPSPLAPLPGSGTGSSLPAPSIPLPGAGGFGATNTGSGGETDRVNWNNKPIPIVDPRDTNTGGMTAPPPNPFADKTGALPLPVELPKPTLSAGTSETLPQPRMGFGEAPPTRPDRVALPPIGGEPIGGRQPGEAIGERNPTRPLPLPTNPLPTNGTTGGGLPPLPTLDTPPSGGGVPEVKTLPLPTLPVAGEPTGTAGLPKPSNPFEEKVDPTKVPALPPASVGTPPPIALPAGLSKEPAFREEKAPPLPALSGLTPAGGSLTVPPTSPTESAPKTDFDVDIVRVRNTDSYASISEAFYGTKQYAAALRSFNRGADLGQIREVQVPPMHVIRKQQTGRGAEASDDSRVVPTGGVRGPVLDAPVQSDTPESPDWGTPGKRRSSVRYEKYTTPRDGMTAREVAKAVYDDEREWAKLTGPRGTRLRADDTLPRGTEVTVPREELPWK